MTDRPLCANDAETLLGEAAGSSTAPASDLADHKLMAWANALELYARDWDKTFENRPNYFTQEFWYLLVGCLVAQMKDRPMTVSAACQNMKSGSSRTREDRLKRAVDDGYLIKERASSDKREAIVRPTPKLEGMMREHFIRTREIAKHALEN